MHNENLIKILGIENLEDDRKLKILDEAEKLIEKRVFVRVLEALTDEKRDEFQKLLDKDDAAAVNDFLAEEVPNMQEWIAEEVGELKEELKSLGEEEI